MKCDLLALVLVLGAATVTSGADARITVPLDGTWQIDDSVQANEPPATFTHTVPVPGLARLAQPVFPDVDKFDSRELISNLIGKGRLPESARTTAVGVPRQNRNYFWYARTFRAPAQKEVALLRINKAQFGTAVWLNGKMIGEHAGCFTAGTFDLTTAIDWHGENTLVVRIGAHPAVLPASVPSGTDFEKTLWTPGIYDSVALILCDNPVIETVQVAPSVAPRQIVVQTVLRNYGAKAKRGELGARVREWRGGREIAVGSPQGYAVAAGETQTLTGTIALPDARLWSPDDPFLHTVTLAGGGDETTTRFGLREFRADTATHRFLLNGRPIFLRGSNVTLHRFFEDAQCEARPWDEAWLHRLLVELPRQMNWNAFRFCIGPVPDRWLEIADEAGLLIQQEYFIWTGAKPEAFHAEWTQASLTRELSEFVRDNGNHPSVALWDACNETIAPMLADVIRAVRPLDHSQRPWDNGYNPPVGPDDPVETHPYENWRDGNEYRFAQHEQMHADVFGYKTPKTDHPVLVNEYGWLWLNRDGTPTLLTKKIYDTFVGENATPEQRFEFDAYYLAALTEYWRAYRTVAGVLHFVYLTSSYPGAFTADHFRDVARLELEPRFAGYLTQAFKPLGVYINLWRKKLSAGSTETIPVMLVNDFDRPVRGRVALVLEDDAGRELRRVMAPFAMEALGRETLALTVTLPAASGRHRLSAVASANPALPQGDTISRRKFELVAAADVPVIPPVAVAKP